MKIYLDLIGCHDERDVLLRVGEILQFGGLKGNICSAEISEDKRNKIGWGFNWDSFDDCMYSFHERGLRGNGPKVEFPLTILVNNFQEFKDADHEKFAVFEKMLLNHSKRYSEEGKLFEIIFID